MTQISLHTGNMVQTLADVPFMRVVERIMLRRTDALSVLCHRTKNLYNLGNYLVRQRFIKSDSKQRRWMRYQEIWALVKYHEAYKQLPAQTAQQTLRLLDRNWKSFFKSIKEWVVHPEKFLGRPRLPKYLKKDGETIAIFTAQTARLRNSMLLFPKKADLAPIKLRPHIRSLHEVRIIPKFDRYIVEIVYDRQMQQHPVDINRAIGIDIGVNNLLTAANNIGLAPVIVKGRVLKSVNQFYNKRVAHLRSKLAKEANALNKKSGYMSAQLKRLERYRYCKIRDYMHNASRWIVNYCIDHQIGRIVIGKNDGWKQNASLGSRTNQNFVQIPFNTLVSMISYKAKVAGIEIILVNEAYTSICSVLDDETVEKHGVYKGKRIHRGLFRSADGTYINADVNAAANILIQGLPGITWFCEKKSLTRSPRIAVI